MKLTFLLSCIGTILFQTTMAQSTFYTRLASATNDWDNADRWTLTSSGVGTADGIPSRTDHIVILSGETVLINNVADNGSAGVSADGLNLYNVGPFIGSDVANFYQTGNITIESGGVLNITVRLMLGGATLIEGTMDASSDVINLGQLESISGSTFTLGDDLILSGTGKTIIDNLTTIDDDLYIDHTEARLCGTGEINIGNEPLGAIINYLNSASILQVCSAFTITCTSTCDGGLPATGTGGFTFDLNQFNYAKTITIDNTRVAGDLTNFPVLINYSNPSIRTTGDGGGISNSNGYDIIFATSGACGSVTQLDHQIESYSSNGTTGTLIAWVNVPLVEDLNDTEILMYYGNASVTDDISVSTTFDTNYLSIWHLNEDPTGGAPQFNDITPSGHTGTDMGSMAGNIAGQIGNGIILDGAGDYVQTTSNELATENNFTISVWFNADATLASHIIWEGRGTENGWGGVVGAAQEMNLSLGYCCLGGAGNPVTGDRISFFLGDIEEENSSNVLSVDGGPFVETSNWHYLVGTISDMDGVGGTPTSELWLDGLLLDTNEGVVGTYTARNLWDTNLRIGGPGTAQRYFNGQLDEVRVSNIVRSAEWIETEYNNQSSPGTFYTISSGASINPCGPLPIDLLYFRGAPLQKSILLSWATSSEINNDFFSLERSLDGKTYEVIGTIRGAGNSKDRIEYSFTDNNPGSGFNYYRLKQTDFDGAYSYSRLISINRNLPFQQDFQIYPNPSNGIFRLTGNVAFIGENSITIHDPTGKVVKGFTMKNENTNLDIEFDLTGMPKGIYYLNISNPSIKAVKMLILE